MLYAKLRIVSCWAIGLAVAVVVAGHWLASSVAHTSELPVQKPTDQPKSAPKENPKPAVLQLRDLREADYTFRTTHLAKNPRVTMPDATIPDKAFAAVNDEKDRTLRFTAKGDEVAILLEKNVTGKLTAKSDTERHYELQDGLFAGGRLTLTQGSDGVVVTYTIFGSGVPVIASYRGQLLPKEAPPGAASLTFRQVLRVPAEANDDFRHAVVAASSEHKAILARNYIVTGGENVQSSGLHLWYLDTDKPIRTNIGDGTRFGFVPKSTLAFNASWVADVEFWDTVTHKKVGNSLPHAMREDSGLLPAVHPDGTVMVTRSKLNQVQFWDIQTRKALTPAHEQGGMVGGLEFTVDGQWCITATYKGELCVWEAKTGKRVAGPVPHELVGSTTAYAAKPQVFVTVENNKLSDEVWRSAAVLRAAKDGREVRRVAMTGHIREIHWIDDTHLLIIGDDRQAGAPAPITRGRRLLRVVTLGPKEADVQTIVKDSRWLTNIAVARDGQYVIASPRDGTTSCWKVGTTDARWTKPGDYEIRSGDGNWVLLIGNREVIACALADGKELWRREKGEHALVQGAHIWLFGAKGVEVWQVVGKE